MEPEERKRLLSNLRLLSFFSFLPPHVQRLLYYGIPMQEPKPDQHRRVQTYITALVNERWTDQQIQDFFTSDLPFQAIAIFKETHQGDHERVITDSVASACSRPEYKNASDTVLTRLLDKDWWLNGRKQLPVDCELQPSLSPDALPCLHRLGTFAHRLYDNPQPGHYLAALPMGIGKTRKFLLPFVFHCVKENPQRGLIVAVERREQVKEYAAWVNAELGKAGIKPQAFALVGHDKVSCPLAKEGKPYSPEDCPTYHQRYAAKASAY